MKYFVVRHKETQKLLPQSFAKGSTWWHPEVANEDDFKQLPRLFYSQRAAKNCIIMWAKGHALKHREYGYDFEGNEDNDEWLEWETVPGRERNQLEVVPVYFKFGEAE